ncbi:hypothetical protein CLAFUW4_12836 [Fulvia fulva]|uniref:Uncharacterized protein n=1 Tax=Passalora fulva TaxID=5499 RepID=A0A9Q8PK09_PASFU|nr:uncharacterized protein CLAFUR5_12702 [Fulvia fulva]KAK4611903.1 hypothetical protein CLAFUR4_12840 [Fulvia fulva]KAK4612560.1 hypothetical protein CLAFUR0_12846 [Fulvia fulva]UJO23910.1 hypothetical protein CLAFUR5_12702 [Fulvia fulva]WPV21676.1 hypothetical protein CLAFUW4_12836 [Fulvia fulva]WPV36062.1 hypothetical protein CLAFUW7_12844 [Fulvia fulva]
MALLRRLPLESRWMIYEQYTYSPDPSNLWYSNHWSGLPKGHGIGSKIDGTAIVNLITAFPDLVPDLHNLRTLVFEAEHFHLCISIPHKRLPHLESLRQLLKVPNVGPTLHTAVDVTARDQYHVRHLLGVFLATRQSVNVTIMSTLRYCGETRLPARLITVAENMIRSRGVALRVIEDSTWCCLQEGTSNCEHFVPKGLVRLPEC